MMSVDKIHNKYIDIKVKHGNSKTTIKMEVGCIFETKTSKFQVGADGKLNIFDKNTNSWRTSDNMELTNYQLNAIKAVANNKDEGLGGITLSQADIKTAVEQAQKGQVTEDISEFIGDYKVKEGKSNKVDNSVSVYVTNGKNSESSELTFKSNTKVYTNTPKPLVSGKGITTKEGKTVTLNKDIASYSLQREYSMDVYRIVKANPQIQWHITFDKDNRAILHPDTLPKGTVLNIPKEYNIVAGSVKSLADVSKVTGMPESYIKDILQGIEGRKGKPALKAYKDKVGSDGGTWTIGFGHCGRVNGKPIDENTTITELQAYELLAQDLLDAKSAAVDYLGYENFYDAPKSLQVAIVDIVFNKGVYSGMELIGSKTTKIKSDLEKKDYVSASVDTIRKTGAKGLRKRNIYRAIMATGSLSSTDRKKALKRMEADYKAVLAEFKGSDKKHLERAWENAWKGQTTGFKLDERDYFADFLSKICLD
jgi:GH24 family phage-related lysozyme (muramidase)